MGIDLTLFYKKFLQVIKVTQPKEICDKMGNKGLEGLSAEERKKVLEESGFFVYSLAYLQDRWKAAVTEGAIDTQFFSQFTPSELAPFGIALSSVYTLKNQESNAESNEHDVAVNLLVDMLKGFFVYYAWVEKLGTSEKESILEYAKVRQKEGKVLHKMNEWEVLKAFKTSSAFDTLFDMQESAKNGNATYVEYAEFFEAFKNRHKTKVVNVSIEQAVNTILAKMEVLYGKLWDDQWVALLGNGGNYVINTKYKGTKLEVYLQRISNFLNAYMTKWCARADIDENKIMSTVLQEDEKEPFETYIIVDEKGIPTVDYAPFLHCTYLADSKSWLDRKKKLKNYLLDLFTCASECTDGSMANVEDLKNIYAKVLTSGVFVTSINQHTVILRSSNISDIDEFKQDVKTELLKSTAQGDKGTILSVKLWPKGAEPESEGNRGIFNTTLIYSMQDFEKEVLFAYKLYTGSNAVKVNIVNPVLGVKFDGDLYSEELFAKYATCILAGSRSGKGTLAMSLIAPLLATGANMVYLDEKPDIAGLFWSLEREYAAQGIDVKFPVVDALGQVSQFESDNHGNRGLVIDENTGLYINCANIPKWYATNEIENLKILRTYKMIQLVMVFCQVYGSRDIKEITHKNDITPYYIFVDEITDLTKKIAGLYAYLFSLLKSKDAPEQHEYAEKIQGIVKDVSDGIGDVIMAAKGTNNFKFILTGQELRESNTWGGKGAEGELKKKMEDCFVYQLMRAADTRWLSGKMQLNTETYAIKGDEKKFMGRTGVFMYHTEQPLVPLYSLPFKGKATGIKGTMFRSYFALVKNDIEETYDKYMKMWKEEGLVALKGYLIEHKNENYTNPFLLSRIEMGEDELQMGFDELYKDGKAVEGVGFSGLIKLIAQASGLDIQSPEYIAKLNKSYNQLYEVLDKAGILAEHGYTCLENYLYDCSADSIYRSEELVKRAKATIRTGKPYTAPNSNRGVVGTGGKEMGTWGGTSNSPESKAENMQSEPKNMQSETENMQPEPKNMQSETEHMQSESENMRPESENMQSEPKNMQPERANSSEPINKQAESTSTSTYNTETKSSKDTKKVNEYREPLVIPDDANPYMTRGTGTGAVTTICSLRELTTLLLQNIKEVYGGLRRIDSLEVTKEGTLIINNMAYKPAFDESFIESAPYSIREKLKEGCVQEIFDFSKLYKFVNLQTLIIEDGNFAQGRLRRELNIKPRKRYSVLFKYFDSLTYIQVGAIKYTRATADEEREDEEGETIKGLGFFSRMKSLFGGGRANGEAPIIPRQENSRMDDFWNSKPIRAMTTGLGWTATTYGVYLAASLFGPWGLLFGAFTAASAYKNSKARNNTKYTRADAENTRYKTTKKTKKTDEED